MSEEKTNGNFKVSGKTSGAPTAEPKRRVAKPSMYKVRLLNDDFTPIDFVTYVIQKFFHKSIDESMSITMQIHKTGSAICGLYTKDVAETKVGIVNDYARKSQHPLKCTLEEQA